MKKTTSKNTGINKIIDVLRLELEMSHFHSENELFLIEIQKRKNILKLKRDEEYFEFLDTSAEERQHLIKAVLSGPTSSAHMGKQLRRIEERFRLAISSTNSGLWEWNQEKEKEIWLSEECYAMLGYQREEFSGQFVEFLKLLHPDFRKASKAMISKHIESPKDPFESVVQILTKERGYVWFRINGVLQEYQGVNPELRMVGTLVDVNDKKTAEKKMQELNVELERFAYLASHDLKEPLLTVTSFTQLFRKEYGAELDANAMQYIDFIDSSISRMITLTDDLLRYSQLDNKSLKFKAVDLNTIVNNIKKDLLNSILETRAEIKVDHLPTIVCDASQIKQLFQNLISNGLKYQEEGSVPRLVISSRKIPGGYEFFVTDNGIGIAPRHQKQIWEVFKRLHSQSEYKGSGIGLANCKRIVDNHEGTINVESQEDKGSTFYFTIPNLMRNA